MKPVGEASREAILSGHCRLCGTSRNLDIHHVVPRRIKRDDSPANLICLCRDCHQAVHDLRVDLAPVLSASEQAKAVELTGSIEGARRLLTPSAYRLVTHTSEDVA